MNFFELVRFRSLGLKITVMAFCLCSGGSTKAGELRASDEKKNVVVEYFSALQTGKFDRLTNLFAENIVWHQPGRGRLSQTYKGREAVFALFAQFMELSEGSFRINKVSNIMNNGDLVAATLHFSAKRQGRAISMKGVDLMRIEGGRIVEVWLFSADQDIEDNFWN